MSSEQKNLWGKADDMSREALVKRVMKRNGTIVPFDFAKVVSAVDRAMRSAQEGSSAEAEKVASAVFDQVATIAARYKTFVPTVEGIQDEVERQLIIAQHAKTAKSYILYRDERSKMRETARQVPENVKALALESKKYFKNTLGEFVYYRTYARWIESEARRETWIETVDRYMSFMRENLGAKLSEGEYEEIRQGILN